MLSRHGVLMAACQRVLLTGLARSMLRVTTGRRQAKVKAVGQVLSKVPMVNSQLGRGAFVDAVPIVSMYRVIEEGVAVLAADKIVVAFAAEYATDGQVAAEMGII